MLPLCYWLNALTFLQRMKTLCSKLRLFCDFAHELREFCLRHPEVKDVCDIGQMLFGGHPFFWYATAVMFILNNTFIQVSACSLSPAHSC